VGVQAVLGLAHLTFEGFQACRELAYFQLLGGGQAQLVGAAGLDQVVCGAGLDRIYCGVHGRVSGDDHYPHPGCLGTHLCQYVEAVVFAQAQVEEAQVEYLALQQSIGLRRAVGGGHGVALVFQAVAEGAKDCGFVIHQKDAALILRR
jgi:hypothetical protein